MPGQPAPDNRNWRVSHEDRDQVAEQLRVAAGDGRLTAEELGERLGTALTARTYGELEPVLAGLPAFPGAESVPAPEARELVHLNIEHGNITRKGRWAVPRRLVVEARHGNAVGNLVIRGPRPRRFFWNWLLCRRPLPARELPGR